MIVIVSIPTQYEAQQRASTSQPKWTTKMNEKLKDQEGKWNGLIGTDLYEEDCRKNSKISLHGSAK
jgi:hypothetical protein